MDTFINEDAKLAVERGINWLDENHPNWVSRIDLTELDMSECENCVIGQAVGDYTRVTCDVVQSATYSQAIVWAVEHGFESPGAVGYQQVTGKPATYNYRDLDTLWSEEVQRRLG